jgi:hypothetical protein
MGLFGRMFGRSGKPEKKAAQPEAGTKSGAKWSKGFVDCKDGTLADYKNGLMWQKIHAPKKMTRQEAAAYCKSLKLASKEDWRLPTIEEFRILFKIPDGSAYMSKIDDLCWTCSDPLGGPANVALASDGTSFAKTERLCVRAVRNI